MDIDEIFIVVITMFIDTANISAIRTCCFCTLLDEGTYLLDPFPDPVSKLFYSIKCMSLPMKDRPYMMDQLFILSLVVMDWFLRMMVIHYFLINLNTDMMPRAMDEAAATTASTL